MEKHTISLIGLGKLGLPLALSFASSGYKVYGIDINDNLVRTLSQRKAPYYEPDLQNFLLKTKSRFIPSSDHSNAINQSDVTIILVATPTDKYGNFSNKYILNVVTKLGNLLKTSSKLYHQFVISSTVMPGSLNGEIIPALENASGRKINIGFGLSYVPDFVAIGKVISDFLHPDFVMIGTDNPKDGNIISAIYQKMVQNDAPVIKTSLVSAELAKVALNNFLTLKISYANLLANLCERIPGANVDDVTNIIGLDARIGRKYLKGGLRFGGTCFPRDTKALSVLVDQYHVERGLVDGMNKTNIFQDHNLYKTVLRALKSLKIEKPNLLIAGMSFKPDTGVTEESAGIDLVNRLLKSRQSHSLTLYDPLAYEETKNIYGNQVTCIKSHPTEINKYDIIVITNPDSTYKSIAKSKLKNGCIVIDCWRLLDKKELNPSIRYVALGAYSN